jgi:hypothetical protein
MLPGIQRFEPLVKTSVPPAAGKYILHAPDLFCLCPPQCLSTVGEQQQQTKRAFDEPFNPVCSRCCFSRIVHAHSCDVRLPRLNTGVPLGYTVVKHGGSFLRPCPPDTGDELAPIS